jgi:hypothetical protein
MAQLFNIQDDKVVINKLALRYLEGSVIHAGTLDIVGNTSVQANLAVTGTITADTLNVKNLVTESGSLAEVGQWQGVAESDIVGKGFTWTWGSGSTALMYRNGGRLWTNSDIDIDAANSYKIDNVTVLSASELAPQITKSNLRQVGNLINLTVLGTTSLSEFAYFNSSTARLGLNTDQPNATLSIVDNDVEIAIGSPAYGRANIGTYSNHDLEFITDNTTRILVKADGDIVFGDSANKTANVTINGTLTVDTLVADTRIDRYSSLEFKSSRDSSIYGKGLIWTGSGNPRQVIMMENPDRLWASVSYDVAEGNAYYVNGQMVLTGDTLGNNVVNSSLTRVGTLQSLSVNGESTFAGNIRSSNIQTSFLTITDGVKQTGFSPSKINSSENFSIRVFEDETYYADSNEIVLGNRSNVRRPVKVFGPLTVGVNNPDPSVALEVAGNVSFGGKKFITANSAPTEGTFEQGDICWNNTPTADNYVGWICVTGGAPGTWLPFGAIARQ